MNTTHQLVIPLKKMADSKMPKLKLRFSLKVFLLLPVVVGLSLTAGHLTQTYGTNHVQEWLEENEAGGYHPVKCEGPFLVSQSSITISINNTAYTNKTIYVWLYFATYEWPWMIEYADPVDNDNSFSQIVERRHQ